MEELIYGGKFAFQNRWASLIVGSKFTVSALVYFVFEGRFNGGFFVLPVWGAFIWRGLYMEGLIFGSLRYYADQVICDVIAGA